MSQLAHVEHGVFGKSTTGISTSFCDGTQPCAQTDPEIFYPETAKEEALNRHTVKSICGHCEFQAKCLEYGLTHEVYGIWGGMGESERRALKRRRRLSA
jgi:WhiB family transcriptional regulator, redox-sensing transcriptional regulator